MVENAAGWVFFCNLERSERSLSQQIILGLNEILLIIGIPRYARDFRRGLRHWSRTGLASRRLRGRDRNSNVRLRTGARRTSSGTSSNTECTGTAFPASRRRNNETP